MQYLKFTQVDFLTKKSITEAPSHAGRTHPDVPGMEYLFSEESKYPTGVPISYGVIDTKAYPAYDHKGSPISGVLAVISEDEFNQAKQAEFEARKPFLLHQLDDYKLSIQSNGVRFEFSDRSGVVQTRNQQDFAVVSRLGFSALVLTQQGKEDALMDFRDSENFVHSVPAKEILEMAKAVQDFENALAKTTWRHKDIIKSTIQSFDELVTYSIYTDWPSNDIN